MIAPQRQRPAGPEILTQTLSRHVWPRLRREGPFYLAIVGLLLLTLLTMNGWGAQSAPSSPLPQGVRQANVRAYSLPTPKAGVMFPAADPQGNLWWGEMLTNHLSRLDPKTGKVSSWTPPDGRNNIMTVKSDSAGHIWFAEQLANYIGRFDPTSQQFTTFPLPSAGTSPAAPQDIVFDSHGQLWVTLLNAGSIARLDPATGDLKLFSLPEVDGHKALPFSLAVAPDGKLWFGLLGQGAVGVLDPSSGQAQFSRLSDIQSTVFSMASDASGHVWFTELEDGRLGAIDTATGQVRELDLPRRIGDPASLYSVVVAPSGQVWLASAGANALVQYTPSTATFTYFQLSRKSSVPYGLAFDAKGALWYTASSVPDNYVGVLPGNAQE